MLFLNLAFKPNTDDVREPPSIRIVNRLLEGSARVVVYDLRALEDARRIFGDHYFTYNVA